MDDARVSLGARGSIMDEATDVAVAATTDEDVGTSRSIPRDITTPSISFEPGQYVMLVDEAGDEVGKGTVFQVSGHFFGRILDNSGTCIVDIKELSVDRYSNLPHPLEAGGNSFYEAEKRLGLMRVLWDTNKLFLYFEPGEDVIVLSEKGQEIGKGTVFQVRGKSCGENLEQSGMCFVDIKELSIDRFSDLPHPVKATGNSFYQAEKRLGLMRVVWDLNRLSRSQAQ